jgi:hypothetical protein
MDTIDQKMERISSLWTIIDLGMASPEEKAECHELVGEALREMAKRDARNPGLVRLSRLVLWLYNRSPHDA